MGSNDLSKTCILITSSSILKLDDEEPPPGIVAMRHPRSGKGTLFLLTKNNSAIEELFLYTEKRSWFIDDAVVSEPRIYFSTPVDPLFLILPYLLKIHHEKKVIPLEDLLVDESYPEICRLLHTPVMQSLHLIADRKGPDDLNAWEYNEQKAMEWLKKKTEKLAAFFNEKQNYVKKGATSANFVKSLKSNSDSVSDHEDNMKYAYEIVSEYLTEELSAKLASNLGIKETVAEKRKLSQTDYEDGQEINKKAKRSVEKSSSNSLKDIKSKSNGVKEKSTKKCEKASQQITNFFKRK